MTEARGLGRNAANHGDREFAPSLRRSFAKSMGHSREASARPVVGIADTGSDLNNRHRSAPELVETGDRVRLSVASRALDPLVDGATLAARRARWSPPPAPRRGWAACLFSLKPRA